MREVPYQELYPTGGRMRTTKELYESLFKSGLWMIRTSNNGKSYNDFQWVEKGEWTFAPDWKDEPKCGNGLHGQNAKAHGYFQISGQRLELCETVAFQVIIDGDKLKTPSARIIAIDEEIPLMFLESVGLRFKDSMPSLKNLTKVAGVLSIYTKVDLPALISVGGSLFIHSKVDLPALTSVGDNLSIHTKVDLSALISVGGSLNIYAEANLPALISVGGSLILYSKVDLPALTSVGGYLFIYAKVSLPTLTSVGGHQGEFIKSILHAIK